MAQVQKNDDIAPSLIKAVQDAVNANVRANNRLTELRDLIENGWATYADAAEYALEYGNMVKQAMAANVSSAVLPDGKMYWNIADRLFDQIMAQEFSEISQQCEQVQTALNQAAGLGVKAQVPELDPEKIKGLKEYASRADQYDNVKASVENALVTYSQSIVDESVKKNADSQAKAGMHPRIIRRTSGRCCEWCSRLAGSYDYPEDTPDDVFRRHANCNCVVEYYPGDGKRQNVWTKVWSNEIRSNTGSEKSDTSSRKIIIPKILSDVTDQYSYQEATDIEYEEGYEISKKHKDEIEVAKFLHSKFGGSIKLLKEANKDKVKTPDYLWNGKLWDLKTTTSEKAADGAIKRGLVQIAPNPGGIILDYRGYNIDINNMLEIAADRIFRSSKFDLDIMTIFAEDDYMIFRYKKDR